MTNAINTAFMRYTTPKERRITRALIQAALNRGWTVSVYDSPEAGGNWTVKRAKSVATVTDALATTGGDVLHFTGPKGAGAGQIVLIWGNDADLIHDYTDTPAMREIIAETELWK